MQRNLNLIKDILLQIEETNTFDKTIHIKIENATREEIQYNILILADLDYIIAHNTVYGLMPYRLTASDMTF